MNSHKPAWSRDARTGPLRRYMDLVLFACEGLVCIIDERPSYEGQFTVVTPSELEERLVAMNVSYRNKTRAELPTWKRQEHDRQRAGRQDCMECVKEARFMGDPSDLKVQTFWAKHRRNKIFNFSPSTDPASYPALPPLPLGSFTGKTAEAGQAASLRSAVADDLQIYQPPTRKPRTNKLTLLD